MSNWLASHTYLPTWIALLCNDNFRGFLRRVFKPVKSGATIAVIYLTAKIVGYALRFVMTKEEMTKMVIYLVIGYVASQVLKELPKTSEQSPA